MFAHSGPPLWPVLGSGGDEHACWLAYPMMQWEKRAAVKRNDGHSCRCMNAEDLRAGAGAERRVQACQRCHGAGRSGGQAAWRLQTGRRAMLPTSGGTHLSQLRIIPPFPSTTSHNWTPAVPCSVPASAVFALPGSRWLRGGPLSLASCASWCVEAPQLCLCLPCAPMLSMLQPPCVPDGPPACGSTFPHRNNKSPVTSAVEPAQPHQAKLGSLSGIEI